MIYYIINNKKYVDDNFGKRIFYMTNYYENAI